MLFLVNLKKSGGILKGASGWIPERAPEKISKRGILKKESQKKLHTKPSKKLQDELQMEHLIESHRELLEHLRRHSWRISHFGPKKLPEKFQMDSSPKKSLVSSWIFFWNSFRKSFRDFLKNLIKKSSSSCFWNFSRRLIQEILSGSFQLFLGRFL